ncbi:hypothetical protein TUM12370_17500 [Salmonella enterica subsp. enterica serovar Choleraesuis]|nr:hypothetical protein TUM12370_17500 [Salmonella enterica subsp. enterica serovar Choleraesuis]
MTPITENAPAIIEKTIDFMASTYAFREYLNQAYPIETVLEAIPEYQHAFFLQRLEHYREIYTPASKRKAVPTKTE